MTTTICAIHRRLYAALDNVQESYGLLQAGAFPDADLCQDLLEQLAQASQAVAEWRALLDGEGRVH